MPDGTKTYHAESQPKASFSELEQRILSGEIINSQGIVAVPKYLDKDWQRTVTSLYGELSDALEDVAGYRPFLVYGSLLGAVREGRPLGHDYDLDTAYLSDHSGVDEVLEEAAQIALALQARGLFVDMRASCLHVSGPDHSQRVDLYHFFFNEDGELRLAWGAANPVPFQKEQWEGMEQIEFAGADVFVPRHAEQLVSTFYGPDWRVPNPGFEWNAERKTRASEALFPKQLRADVNWQDYWRRKSFDTPTRFARFVGGLGIARQQVVDLGCGDARDVPLFVRSGARVLGLDYASEAIESARGRRLASDRAEFSLCDLQEAGALEAAVKEFKEPGARHTLYYARQMLDSIPDEAIELLLAQLARLTVPGDHVAFEFRDVADNTLTGHELRDCGRRVVDPDMVREWFDSNGIETLVDEGSSRWERRGSRQVRLHRLIGMRPQA